MCVAPEKSQSGNKYNKWGGQRKQKIKSEKEEIEEGKKGT